MEYQFFNIRTNGMLATTIRVKSKTPLYETAARLRPLFKGLNIESTVHPILGRPIVSAVNLCGQRVS